MSKKRGAACRECLAALRIPTARDSTHRTFTGVVVLVILRVKLKRFLSLNFRQYFFIRITDYSQLSLSRLGEVVVTKYNIVVRNAQ